MSRLSPTVAALFCMPDSNPVHSMTSRRLLAVLRRRAWILIPCVLLATGVAFGISRAQTKRYSSSASLLFTQTDLSQELFGFATSSTIDPTTVTATNIALVSQPSVAVNTAKALRVPTTRVSGEISVAGASSSNIVTVSATDPSPTFAASLANTYANQFITYRAQADRQQVVQAAAQLQAQITRLRTVTPNSKQLPNLDTRLSQLDVLSSVQTGDVQLAQSALVPASPSSPNTKRNTLLGFLAGLILGGFAMLLAERIDQTLRDPDEVRDLSPLPTLGVIPSSRALARDSRSSLSTSPHEAETFRLLRAQLRYFNVDREIRSVLISSAAPGDGKSTVAWNLARTAASLSSDSSVLLVDADLRRPSIARMADLPAAPGLAEVLTRDLTPEEVVRSLPTTDASGVEHGGSFDVLTAGAPAPNPSELLESKKLRHVLDVIQARYDFVVIDAPPTSIVSDAIPLMSQVSGVLLVVRMRHTRRDALRRLSDQLAGLGAPALGLVVNDVSTNANSYGGYYGAYAAYPATSSDSVA